MYVVLLSPDWKSPPPTFPFRFARRDGVGVHPQVGKAVESWGGAVPREKIFISKREAGYNGRDTSFWLVKSYGDPEPPQTHWESSLNVRPEAFLGCLCVIIRPPAVLAPGKQTLLEDFFRTVQEEDASHIAHVCHGGFPTLLSRPPPPVRSTADTRTFSVKFSRAS